MKASGGLRHPEPGNSGTGPGQESGDSIEIHFIRSTLAVARASGLSTDALLRAAQISPELVRIDTSRVTAIQARDLMQAVWRESGDELLGLGPRPVPLGTFEMICLAIIHSRDLRSALTRFVRFLSISTGISRITLTQRGTTAEIVLAPTGGQLVNPLVVEILVALIQRFSAWMIGRRIELLSLEFAFPRPAHWYDYDAVFGRIPHFARPKAVISFNAHFLDAPIVRDEEDLDEFLANAPADLLFRRDYGTTISYKVRKILEHNDSGGLISAESVAARLSVSAQHMRRLLQAEGTSFRQLREDSLRDEAITSLSRTNESVGDLAERLGFSEPSAFRRAFTRWTGSTPGTYRTRGTDS